ncbi:MAG TPA: phosphatidylserine decarboxylase family protein [Bacteroidales bacterium]|jgi:phosphatidylserine decarboxylase|nr:phosphatidylserine decarboxylase family protein [Bacteroidales bacterium]
MTIHKEGRSIVALLLIVLVSVNLLVYYFLSGNVAVSWILGIPSFLLFLFVVRFFRKPTRILLSDENTIYAPADGTVLVIEETIEDEFFKDKRIQISIFMSVWNVHINWFPVSGIIKYFKYHPGKFLVARLPKSSTENERTTVVLEDKFQRQILVRQIAGIIARRIISYAKENLEVKQNSELGFIRFGSRVDVFLPLDADVKVKMGDKTKGTQTILATI